MARKKKVQPEVEKKYTTKIKYKCPVRGWVEEEVEVTRFIASEKEPEKSYNYDFIEEETEKEDE